MTPCLFHFISQKIVKSLETVKFDRFINNQIEIQLALNLHSQQFYKLKEFYLKQLTDSLIF